MSTRETVGQADGASPVSAEPLARATPGVAPGSGGAATARILAHLVARELRIRYRRTKFGIAWGVVQPLVRFAVLGFVFGVVLDLQVDNFALYLFTGVVTWAWFAAGVTEAMTSINGRPELTFRPGLPRMVIPTASVLTALVDLLLALPILLVAIVLAGDLSLTALAFPLVMLIQGALVLGTGLLVCSSQVYFRDTKPLVETALAMGFYATPIVYSVDMAPGWAQTVLRLNPMTPLVEAYRAVLYEGRLPLDRWTAYSVVVAVVLLAAGIAVFRACSTNFIDEL